MKEEKALALYHLSVKPVSRSGGRSVCAAAAYRAAELIHDPRMSIDHDYTRRRGVEHTEIIGFNGTRQELWGQTEQVETRKNARLAVEAELALPAELTSDQRRDLVREFAHELASEYGVAVDVAIHAPHRDGDQRNHHAHVLVGCRKVEGDRLTDRVVPFDGPDQVERWRARWAELQNLALERAKVSERVDHRSYERQGIEQEPTEHMGPMVAAIERKAARAAKREGEEPQPVTVVGKRNEATRLFNLRHWITRQLEAVQRAKQTAERLLERVGFKLDRTKSPAEVEKAAPAPERPMTAKDLLKAWQGEKDAKWERLRRSVQTPQAGEASSGGVAEAIKRNREERAAREAREAEDKRRAEQRRLDDERQQRERQERGKRDELAERYLKMTPVQRINDPIFRDIELWRIWKIHDQKHPDMFRDSQIKLYELVVKDTATEKFEAANLIREGKTNIPGLTPEIRKGLVDWYNEKARNGHQHLYQGRDQGISQ